MSINKKESYFLIFLLAIVWGSSFILIKYALPVYTPVQIGALRILVAFLVFVPVVVRDFRMVGRKQWKFLAASGFLGNGLPSILFPLAETRISSAVAGMINSLTPIFTLIVGMLFFGMKTGNNRVGGLTLGLIGAVILITGTTGFSGLGATDSYAFIVVGATVCYAFSVNILRYKLHMLDPLRLTSFALLFAGIPMGIILFSTDFVSRTIATPGAGLAIFYIVLLGVLGSSLSTILFNKVIKVSGALAASSVTYLIPVVAILWGVWDEEVFTFYHLIGLVCILGGVYLVNRGGLRNNAAFQALIKSKVKSQKLVRPEDGLPRQKGGSKKDRN